MSWLLALFLPAAVLSAGGTYEYKGFDSCGLGGWTCRNTPQGYEVIYRCGSFDRNARIWMWTARIPTSATTLAIENCNHVEVHSDCTMGYRGYTMRTFRASNIQELEILRPLAPYVFLHDNDQVPHMPPEVILENIGKVTLFSGIFDKAGRRCRIKQQQLETFKARNVTMHQFLDNKFSDQALQLLELENVNFGSDETMALTVNANVTIIDSMFDNKTASGNITITGSQVTFKNNHFGDLTPGAITAKCHNFEFEGNNVSRAFKSSFDVLAKNVSITYNTILKVDDVAFALIKPGGGPMTRFEASKKAVFRLEGNIMEDIGIMALHPDIEAYNDTCYEFIVQNNLLPCSCPEFNWSTAIDPVQFYYNLFSVRENNNTCAHITPSCNLAEALSFKDNCSFLHTCDSNATPTSTSAPTTNRRTTLNHPTTHKTVPSLFKESSSSTPSMNKGPDVHYSSSAMHEPKTAITFIVCAVGLVVTIVSGVVLYFIYNKRKDATGPGTIYQNQCRSDYDEQNLIDEQ